MIEGQPRENMKIGLKIDAKKTNKTFNNKFAEQEILFGHETLQSRGLQTSETNN